MAASSSQSDGLPILDDDVKFKTWWDKLLLVATAKYPGATRYMTAKTDMGGIAPLVGYPSCGSKVEDQDPTGTVLLQDYLNGKREEDIGSQTHPGKLLKAIRVRGNDARDVMKATDKFVTDNLSLISLICLHMSDHYKDIVHSRATWEESCEDGDVREVARLLLAEFGKNKDDLDVELFKEFQIFSTWLMCDTTNQKDTHTVADYRAAKEVHMRTLSDYGVKLNTVENQLRLTVGFMNNVNSKMRPLIQRGARDKVLTSKMNFAECVHLLRSMERTQDAADEGQTALTEHLKVAQVKTSGAAGGGAKKKYTAAERRDYNKKKRAEQASSHKKNPLHDTNGKGGGGGSGGGKGGGKGGGAKKGSSPASSMTCDYCEKSGHEKAQCRKFKQKLVDDAMGTKSSGAGSAGGGRD